MFAFPSLPAVAADPCADGQLRSSEIVSGNMLLVKWTGTVTDRTGPLIEAAFEKVNHRIKSVVLALHSCGGRSDHMDATISVLNRIKATHPLTTMVDRGATCASACVPIFLAGDRRRAAMSSVWFFHLSWRHVLEGGIDATLKTKTVPESTDRVLDRYFAPAGVSRRWLARLRRIIRENGGYWQTGRDLWERKTGIVTETIGDIEPRDDQPTYLRPPAVCGAMCRG